MNDQTIAILKRDNKILFRRLTPEETKEYKQWARDNYVVGSHINALWHPVTVEECQKMNWECKPI